MKRTNILVVFFLCVVLSLSAQGLYVEGGIGTGVMITDYTIDVLYSESGNWGFLKMNETHPNWATVIGNGLDIGGKLGFGPINGLPLYLVGDIAFQQGKNYKSKFNTDFFDDWGYGFEKGYRELILSHLFFGTGFVFYPTQNFQFAGSIGLASTNLEWKSSYEYFEYIHSDSSILEDYDSFNKSKSSIGFGFNISTALDVGNNHGFLIGGKLSYINNDVHLDLSREEFNFSEIIRFDISTFHFGLFVRYRIRS